MKTTSLSGAAGAGQWGEMKPQMNTDGHGCGGSGVAFRLARGVLSMWLLVGLFGMVGWTAYASGSESSCPKLEIQFKSRAVAKEKLGYEEFEPTDPPRVKIYKKLKYVTIGNWQSDGTRIVKDSRVFFSNDEIPYNSNGDLWPNNYPVLQTNYTLAAVVSLYTNLTIWSFDSAGQETMAESSGTNFEGGFTYGSHYLTEEYTGIFTGGELNGWPHGRDISYSQNSTNYTTHYSSHETINYVDACAGGVGSSIWTPSSWCNYLLTLDYTYNHEEVVSELLEEEITTSNLLQQASQALSAASFVDDLAAGGGPAAYRYLTNTETRVSLGEISYRMRFSAEAGTLFLLLWKEVFTREDGTVTESQKQEWVFGTGSEQFTRTRHITPPAENGKVQVVVENQPCGDCPNGGSSIGDGNLLNFSIGLGNGLDGKPVGSLHLVASTPSTALTTGAAWTLHAGSDVTSSGGELIAPQVIVNQFDDSSGHHITMRHPGEFSPHTSWTISNPDLTGLSSNQVSILKYTDGEFTTTDYEWSDAGQGWTVTTGNGDRKKSTVKTIEVPSGDEIETDTVRDYSDVIVSQSQRKYHVFPFGRALVEMRVDPFGANLKTSYTYYDNAGTDGTNFGRLKLIAPDSGTWTRYTYDNAGRTTKEVSGFGNVAPDASENLGRVTEYDYTPVDVSDSGSIDPETPRRTIIKLKGQEIARSYLIVSPGERTSIVCQTPGAVLNATNNLVTVTKYFTTGGAWVAGKVKQVDHPNGTREVCSYDVSTPELVTHTVLRGAASNSDQVSSGTRTVTVMRDTGTVISKTVYDIESPNIMIGQTVNSDFDGFDRARRTDYLDGTHSLMSYGCCGLESLTKPDGTSLSYEYDDLERLTGTHEILPSDTVLTHSKQYDAESRFVTSYRVAFQGAQPTLVFSDYLEYNPAGQVAIIYGPLGEETHYTHTVDGSGQTTTTITYPDLGTRIETRNRDGTLQRVTGTAVSPVRYEYDVAVVDGIALSTVKEIKLKRTGASTYADTDEWTLAHADGLGRPQLTTYPAASGTPASRWFYNNQGQLVKSVTPDGGTMLLAYNARGQADTTAVDLHGDGLLHKGGTNRVRQTVTDVFDDSGLGEKAFRTRSYVWAVDNTDVSTLVSTVETSVDGRRKWEIIWNGGTPVTNFTGSGYNPTSKLTSVTNTAPDLSRSIATLKFGRVLEAKQLDSTGAQLGKTTLGYDIHGRRETVTDARNGATTYTYDERDLVQTVTAPSADGVQAAQVTTFTYDDLMGRLKVTTLPDGTSTTNEYFVTGLLATNSGSRTYPTAYTYDDAGRMKTMKTWQSYVNKTGAAVTKWNYDPYRGFLASKTYAEGSAAEKLGPSYTYTPAGRVATRTWARGATTTYDYNGSGELASVNYSDSTPDVTFGYDRRGRQTSVAANGATTSLSYNEVGQLLAESYTGGPLDGLSVTNGYDDLMRRTNVAILNIQSSIINSTAYAYDAASRLATVTEGTNSATYGYLANSPLVESITFKQGAATRMTTTKSYDLLNRLTSIQSINAQPSTINSFAYAYNDANQRTAVTNADASRWNFGYDTLGQVTSGKKRWSDGTFVAGEQFEYTFDDIGNRKQSRYSGDANGAGLRRFNYSVNLLNQYTSRSAGPGTTRFANVLGEATNAATVTVNNQAPYRRGDFFRTELAVTNTSPVWLGVTNIAVLNQGTNVDLIATNAGNVFVPPTPEAFGYDADGNMTNDGRFALTWDAENRLVKVESLSSAPVGSKRKVEWMFDGLGRRIRQTESIWNSSTLNYQPSTDIKLVSDGWRNIAELDTTNLTRRTYSWGLDLSGSLGGAGGVGGLLMINSASQGAHFYAMDGNGNVAALVSAATGTATANYEYEPFGVTLRATGPMALENPFRFSTKRTSDATDWVLYEQRAFVPGTGRWLSRDPLTELGGMHLYGFLANDAVNFIDPVGYSGNWSSPGYPGYSMISGNNPVNLQLTLTPIYNPLPTAGPVLSAPTHLAASPYPNPPVVGVSQNGIPLSYTGPPLPSAGLQFAPVPGPVFTGQYQMSTGFQGDALTGGAIGAVGSMISGLHSLDFDQLKNELFLAALTDGLSEFRLGGRVLSLAGEGALGAGVRAGCRRFLTTESTFTAGTAGSGPARGFLEVSDAYGSSRAVQNFSSPRSTDFIFDYQNGRFVLGSNVRMNGQNFQRGHDAIADAAGGIGARDTSIVGGRISLQNGRLVTDEWSGHYGQYWTPPIRQQFTDFMGQHGVNVTHTPW